MRTRLLGGGADGRRPSRAVLANYLAEARVLADTGGGPLAVVEPSLPRHALPAFAGAVAEHLAAHGVLTGELRVVTGSTTARIAVLAPVARVAAEPPRLSDDPARTAQISLADIAEAVRANGGR